MGLLGGIIAKGVITAARNSTIRAVGEATVGVIAATASKPSAKEDVTFKNGIMFIKPTRSSDDYLDKYTPDIIQELFGAGFENITVKPIQRLNERAQKKYGKIVSLSINGKNEFLGIKKVPATSHIVIEYLDFKKNVNQEIYATVERITPGPVHKKTPGASDAAFVLQEVNDAKNFKKFCPFCGSPVVSETAKFCSNCGKEL